MTSRLPHTVQLGTATQSASAIARATPASISDIADRLACGDDLRWLGAPLNLFRVNQIRAAIHSHCYSCRPDVIAAKLLRGLIVVASDRSAQPETDGAR